MKPSWLVVPSIWFLMKFGQMVAIDLLVFPKLIDEMPESVGLYRVAKAKLENYPQGLETRGFF